MRAGVLECEVVIDAPVKWKKKNTENAIVGIDFWG